jgi:hypothetical protein
MDESKIDEDEYGNKIFRSGEGLWTSKKCRVSKLAEDKVTKQKGKQESRKYHKKQDKVEAVDIKSKMYCNRLVWG